MYKKCLVSALFIIILVSNSFAKVEFKEFDDDKVIAYVGEREIKFEEVKNLRGEKRQHIAGIHRRKGDIVPDSWYLKGIIDKLLIAEYSKNNSDPILYKVLLKDAKEAFVLSKYLDSEILPKAEEDGSDSQKLLFNVSSEQLKEYESNGKIEMHKDLLGENVLKKGYDREKVVANVDGYKITLYDVIRKATPYYYEQINPDKIMLREKLDAALDNLIMRAVLIRKAFDAGYGDDIPEPTEEVRLDLLKNAYKAREIEKINITDEELETMYKRNASYYVRKNVLKKFGVILKQSEEDIKKIKERLDSGEDFFEIAVKESEDEPTRENGGIQPYVHNVKAEIDSVLRKLKDGEISDIIILSEKGGVKKYMIIKRIDIFNDELNELKPVVDFDLREEKYKILLKELVRKLNNEAKITINSKLMSEKEFFNLKDEETVAPK